MKNYLQNTRIIVYLKRRITSDMYLPGRKATIFIYVVSAGLFVYSLTSYNFSLSNFNLSHFLKADIKESFDDYARKIVEKCADAKYKPTCYDEEIPKIMESVSMEDAFQITRLVQDKDPSYAYCHVLGHALSAAETAKDPSKWSEVITRCPSGICSNGCVHGAFQERFRTETLNDDELDKLKPELADICEPRGNWNPTGLEQATCYHALGHLLMYVSGADINKSVTICEEVSKKAGGNDWSKLCFDGAFMQIFQPLETEDFALVKGKQPSKEELADFCRPYDSQKRVACWGEGWPLFFEELLKSSGLVKFCTNPILKEPNEQDQCYMGLFYVMTAQFKFDLDKINNYCLGLPQLRKNQCFANVASRLIETDYRNIPKAIQFCASSESSKGYCYDELIKYSTYNFHSGSKEYFELCNSLPNPWKDSCLNHK